MIFGAGRAASLRTKLFLLLAGPLLVMLAAGLGSRSGPDGARLIQRTEESFAALLEEVAHVASTALEYSPRRAWIDAQSAARLGRRVEGISIFTPDLALESWEGTPAEPTSGFDEQNRPGWSVRVDGVRTRLFARAGPDDRGRRALVTYLIDSTLDDLEFAELLPRELRRDAGVEVSFAAPIVIGPEEGATAVLRSTDGAALGTASVHPVSGPGLSRRVRQAARAWAAILFLLLLAILFDWKHRCASWSGALVAGGTLLGGRALLLWQNATGRLLPRELGSPSVYGSSKLEGLLASPADLLLTAATLYLLCTAVRRCVTRTEPPAAWARVATGVLAAAASAAAFGIAVSMARNSRIALLERPAPFELDARLALWVALLLPLLVAAELWARTGRPAPHAPRTAPTVLIVVLLCSVASLLLQRTSERLAEEELRSEYAPQVLDPSSRRTLALTSAMQDVDDRYDPDDAADPQYLAYRRWVGGELFRSRYKSSIDIYAPDGSPLSHFGFGLPPLDETIGEPAPNGVHEEWIDFSTAEQRLLHSQTTIVRDGVAVAIAVGHVLDEPDNLPFLPRSQTYLAALGPGTFDSGAEELQYVLYDAFGGVQLTTLLRPPAETDELRRAADEGRTLSVVAGDESYLALALEQDDGRLHLLLLPRWTPIERLAAIVRLALLALLLMSLLALVARGGRAGGLRELPALLRRSFYRKLVAALLLASIVPLVGLALFLRGYLERRGDAALIASATQFVSAAQRVIEDYTAGEAGDETELTDGILYWLRRIVGQEIHVYGNGVLQASSTRELFDSGLLPPRLPGDVRRLLIEGGAPHVVTSLSIGPSEIPVAYATVRRLDDPGDRLVVAVPLVLEQRQIARGVSRVAEMILLATVTLVGLLAVTAAALARTVARPVRDLVAATGQIAGGDYATRLESHTEDEVAELVKGFNAMASALARQRADLERRRDYIETLLRHATIGVISLDADGRVVTLNPAASALLAAAPLELGADFSKALRGSREYEPLALALGAERSGIPVDADLAGESPRRLRAAHVELRRADGERFGTLILIEDVTDLMRSNQLAAWAEMARAIAHEIKNPLTPIQLSAEHLARLLSDREGGATDDEQACVETIIKQVRALHAIAGEFSAYAKLPVLAPRPTDPVEFLREVIAPYRASKPPGITIEERYAPAPAIAADARVLSRAVINLLENALQAMPEGGTLTVGVEAEQDRVTLTVTDTGHGLDPAVRRRLFEPYFSTKSSGTGLGLAIARRAVEAHGGEIDVASERDRGTTFRIRLPAHRG